MASELREMTIAEELILLLLRMTRASSRPYRSDCMSCALVGAVLLDLSFKNRIDADLEILTLLDAVPTGDELLDPTLATIAAERTPHSPRYWVERLAPRAEDANELVFERLVQREILEHDVAGFWSLSGKVARSGRYPLVDGARGRSPCPIHAHAVRQRDPRSARCHRDWSGAGLSGVQGHADAGGIRRSRSAH